jgi:hypothetical protein
MQRLSLPIIALVAMAASSAAQTASDATAAPQYRSAFTDYRGFKDEPVTPWRGANDEVARIGGHAGVLTGSPSSPSSGSSTPRPVEPNATMSGSGTGKPAMRDPGAPSGHQGHH